LAHTSLEWRVAEFDRSELDSCEHANDHHDAKFILNRLPIGRILGGFVRLIMIAFKPAILAYGVTKLYQAAQSDEE
jgi:hypothetical protein